MTTSRIPRWTVTFPISIRRENVAEEPTGEIGPFAGTVSFSVVAEDPSSAAERVAGLLQEGCREYQWGENFWVEGKC